MIARTDRVRDAHTRATFFSGQKRKSREVISSYRPTGAPAIPLEPLGVHVFASDQRSQCLPVRLTRRSPGGGAMIADTAHVHPVDLDWENAAFARFACFVLFPSPSSSLLSTSPALGHFEANEWSRKSSSSASYFPIHNVAQCAKLSFLLLTFLFLRDSHLCSFFFARSECVARLCGWQEVTP